METERLIDELAADLGASVAARKKWRQRGVPHRWRLPLIEAAEKRGVILTGEDFRPPEDRGVA